jgi:phospholipid/cholesterol/gamma-HCH transport system substrate-binding protein
MKISKVPIARTGIFVTICFALLVVALFVIGDKEKLFSSTSTYYVKINEISGLKTGAQVRLSGYPIGSVKGISLPSKIGDPVIIQLTIIEDAKELIRKDSRAEIATDGLVGNKIVSIIGGKLETARSQAGDTLIGVAPFDVGAVVNNVTNTINDASVMLKETAELIKTMRTGDGTMAKLMNDPALYESITTLITASTRSINSINASSAGALSSVRELTDSLKQTVSGLSDITFQIRSGKGSIGKLLTDEELYNKLLAVTGNVQLTMSELNETIHKLSMAAGNGVEVTEALKHNFLVSSYFEDRGYWNTDDFERDIRTKIDSLNRLQRSIDQKLNKLDGK